MSDDKDRIHSYVTNYLTQLNKFPGTWLRAPVPPQQTLLCEKVVKQTITALKLAGIPHDSRGYSLITVHELEDKKP